MKHTLYSLIMVMWAPLTLCMCSRFARDFHVEKKISEALQSHMNRVDYSSRSKLSTSAVVCIANLWMLKLWTSWIIHSPRRLPHYTDPSRNKTRNLYSVVRIIDSTRSVDTVDMLEHVKIAKLTIYIYGYVILWKLHETICTVTRMWYIECT